MKKPKRMFKDREPLATVKAGRYDPNDVRYVATHEAGHAVSAVVLGLPLKSVDLERRRLPGGVYSLGYTDLGTTTAVRDLVGMTEEALMPMVIQIMAGQMAESVVNPLCLTCDGHRRDLEDARQRVAIALCKHTTRWDGRCEITGEEMQRNMPRLQGLFDRAGSETARLVKDNRQAIERVAELLLERKKLTGAEVAAIVNAA